MRLSEETLGALSAEVVKPGYARAEQAIGIVHLGLGAFHRAHQAVFTDDAMNAGDRDWAIAGVSLRSTDVRAALAPQDGLYSVALRGGATEEIRVVGAVRDVIAAPQSAPALAALLAARSTRLVTLTVTEKGYCRRPDGTLDDEAARGPASIYSILAAALRARRTQGIGGLTLVSCDNLAQNGEVLTSLMAEYLDRHAPEETGWFERECACPSTMVDRIVPAPVAADRAAAATRLGVRDEAAIVTEPFRQWIIEDRFASDRPRWHQVGADLVADVRPYETAKLRMLNGAHSALAYIGLAAGHTYVHEAVSDHTVRPLVERLMRIEAAGTIETAPGQDLQAYADALLLRFANASLPHKLAQIATDGSQKIGQRWLEPLTINIARGVACPATLEALAAWIVYLRGDLTPVLDPKADDLSRRWQEAGTASVAAALFGSGGLLAPLWTAPEQQLKLITDHVIERCCSLPSACSN